MLRTAFWSLLILNAAMFAYAQGYLGSAKTQEHEPERLNRQFNTAKMVLLSREQADAAEKTAKAEKAAKAAQAASAPADAPAAEEPAQQAAPATAAAPAPALACVEAGPFDERDARRFETRVGALDLGARLARQEVPGQDVHSWLVNIPPQGSKEAAEKKAAELRNLGVTDFYIMPADSAMKYAISLGMFKTESGAQAMLANLNKQGVHSARITPRGTPATHIVYRIAKVDAATREKIAGIAGRFDDVAVNTCAQR